MQQCEHCEKVDHALVEKFKIETVDIHSEGYGGYIPDQVPILQTKGLTLLGPIQINAVLGLMKYAQEE